MDIMTGAGLVAGTIVVATLMLLGGDLNIFVSDHAVIIIFGGSTAATMIRFPLGAILHGVPLGAKFAFTMSRLSARDLLDELARRFAQHRFDPKFLIRAITASRTYQLTSAGGHPGPDDPRLFARMALKGLTPDQAFDSPY